jgi:uncharacterized membrane protein
MTLLRILPLLLFFYLLLLLPLAFGQMFTAALIKLRLEPNTALLLVAGIFIGSWINIPVKRLAQTEAQTHDPFAIFGLHGSWTHRHRIQQGTVIVVNVGGCVIPVGLAAYEAVHLLIGGWQPFFGLLLAIFINTIVCYRMARSIEGVGIAMPGMFPPLIAAMSALLLAPDQATPVAFVAGVLGPLIGADLLHLRDISKIATGIASIGGAGTFDGIVLSGIVAAYLA